MQIKNELKKLNIVLKREGNQKTLFNTISMVKEEPNTTVQKCTLSLINS